VAGTTGFAISANGTASAGAVSQVGIAAVNSNQVVTAFRNGNGALELIAWAVGGGKVTRQGSATGSAVSQAAICEWGGLALTSGSVVTAVINSEGNLEVTSWNVSASGSITAAAGSSGTGGSASQVAVCSVPTIGNPITAVRGGKGELALEVWGDDGGVEIVTSDTSSDISAVAVASQGYQTAGKNGYFTTATIAAKSKDLEVSVWSFNV
jgi:hypothetical protein